MYYNFDDLYEGLVLESLARLYKITNGVVVIDGIVDTSADDFDELLSDIFGIISKEAETHFNSSLDIVVYWYFSEEDYIGVKQSSTIWGSSVKFYDECNAVMLSL